MHAMPLLLLLLVPPDPPVAQHFEKDRISTPLHGCIAFAPDGMTAYFTRRDTVRNKSFIVESRLENGAWSSPQVTRFSGLHSDGDPALSPDGRRLVFWSSRPVGAGAPALPHLWFVDREGAAWGEPRAVKAGGAALFGMGPAIAADGTIYFFRAGPRAGAPPWLSLLRSSGGSYSAPEYLDETINGAYGGGDSTVARDQSFLIFSSSRPDSLGSGDLYISSRRNGKWTPPRNLGPAVNSRNNEYCPSLSPDGLRLYFTRSEEGIFFIPLSALNLP